MDPHLPSIYPSFVSIYIIHGSVMGMYINGNIPGWWFGTFFIFPHIGKIIIPIDFHIFQWGSSHQPDGNIQYYSICIGISIIPMTYIRYPLEYLHFFHVFPQFIQKYPGGSSDNNILRDHWKSHWIHWKNRLQSMTWVSIGNNVIGISIGISIGILG